jgi:tetratricopeptide (TPR) repeat protein
VLRDKDGGAARALEIGEKLARAARSTAWKARARELQAWAHLVAGNLDAAEAVLERLPPGSEPDPLLEGSLYLARKEWKHAAVLLADALAQHENDDTAARLAHALIQDRRAEEALPLADRPYAGPKTFDQLVSALFYAKRLDEARALGLRWWAAQKNPRLAYNLACIDSRSGRADEACKWLDEAVGAGWRDLRLLDEDPDLEALRKLPAFHQVRARLTSLGRVAG